MSAEQDKRGVPTDDHAVAWPPPPTRLHGDPQKDLFSLLGEVGDVRPSPNFVERTLAYVAEREIRESRSAGAGIWKWGGLAAAASILAVCGYFFGGENDRPADAGREKTSTTAQPVAMVSAPNDDQLTAFEIDGLEEINEAWFGG
jgi:hypothetical protein